ncbi:MAG: hypothetical protein AAFU68_17350, partial [Pseudomonadota bacterium]
MPPGLLHVPPNIPPRSEVLLPLAPFFTFACVRGHNGASVFFFSLLVVIERALLSSLPLARALRIR